MGNTIHDLSTSPAPVTQQRGGSWSWIKFFFVCLFFKRRGSTQRRMQSVFASTADPNNVEILNRLKGRRRGWNRHRLGFSLHVRDVPCGFPLYCVQLKKHTHTLTDRRWRLLTRGDGGKWSMKAQIINTISCPELGCPVCLCLTHMLCSLLSPVVLPEPVLLRWHVQRWESRHSKCANRTSAMCVGLKSRRAGRYFKRNMLICYSSFLITRPARWRLMQEH